MSQQEGLLEKTECESALHEQLTRLASQDDHSRGLWLVGIYKLSKFLFFGALGFGALHMIHANLGDEVMRITEILRLGPESHIVAFVMDKADLVDHHELRQASMFAFGYSLLCLIEGTGLMMRRVWAEYFTVILTVLGLPIEAYELVEKISWLRVGALVINLVVLGYLLWVLKQKSRVCAGAGG